MNSKGHVTMRIIGNNETYEHDNYYSTLASSDMQIMQYKELKNNVLTSYYLIIKVLERVDFGATDYVRFSIETISIDKLPKLQPIMMTNDDELEIQYSVYDGKSITIVDKKSSDIFHFKGTTKPTLIKKKNNSIFDFSTFDSIEFQGQSYDFGIKASDYGKVKRLLYTGKIDQNILNDVAASLIVRTNGCVSEAAISAILDKMLLDVLQHRVTMMSITEGPIVDLINKVDSGNYSTSVDTSLIMGSIDAYLTKKLGRSLDSNTHIELSGFEASKTKFFGRTIGSWVSGKDSNGQLAITRMHQEIRSNNKIKNTSIKMKSSVYSNTGIMQHFLASIGEVSLMGIAKK